MKLDREGRTFNPEKGVRQCGPVSSALFNCAPQSVMNQLPCDEKRYGININRKKLNNLSFADNSALIASAPDNLQREIADLQKYSNHKVYQSTCIEQKEYLTTRRNQL